jgi:hypothetical protein
MKLYRGIKAKEFSHFTPESSQQLNDTWQAILKERARGNLAYPDALNDEILAASKLVRLQRQHFTDNKEIAASYADDNDGLLVEIDVPVSEIISHFTIEFQKFAQRRKNFEVVYVIDAAKLSSLSKKWKMKAIPAGARA